MTCRRINEKCFSCNKVSPRAFAYQPSIIHALSLNANATRDVQMPVRQRWVPRPMHRVCWNQKEKICSSLKRESGSNYEWYGCRRTKRSIHMPNHNKEKVDEMILVTKSLVFFFGGTEFDEGLQQLHFFFQRQHVRRVNSKRWVLQQMNDLNDSQTAKSNDIVAIRYHTRLTDLGETKIRHTNRRSRTESIKQNASASEQWARD